MEEIWKDIDDFEGLYQVSNLGNVKRLVSANCLRERLICRSIDRYGYAIRVLSKNSKSNHFKEHRLVAKSFIPNPLVKTSVNHINGNKTDNRVENLEWCTVKENITHAIETGLKDHKGIKNYNCKLNEKQVLEIREIGFSKTRTALSEKYGVSKSHISRLINNKGWKHL